MGPSDGLGDGGRDVNRIEHVGRAVLAFLGALRLWECVADNEALDGQGLERLQRRRGQETCANG